jgi:hypothetical protein
MGPIAQKLPPERHVPFIADLLAHSASYLVGLIGGIVLMVLVWRSRRRVVILSGVEPIAAATGGDR